MAGLEDDDQVGRVIGQVAGKYQTATLFVEFHADLE